MVYEIPSVFDRAAENRKRIDHAQVCVRVQSIDELHDSLDVEEEGSSFSVTIKYLLKPQRWASCKVLSHHAKICPNFFLITWVPKK